MTDLLTSIARSYDLPPPDVSFDGRQRIAVDLGELIILDDGRLAFRCRHARGTALDISRLPGSTIISGRAGVEMVIAIDVAIIERVFTLAPPKQPRFRSICK